jgi:cytochrome P450
MLLAAQDVDGSQMTDKQIRDEVITLFLAGHETTALALSWAFYLLSQHPEVEARLAAELRDVLGARAPTLEDVPQLTYTEQVITETMRLYPPAWSIGREAIEPVEIHGYRVPVGAQVWMSQWVVHRDPRWFDDAESFRPDRWADGLAKRLPKFAYFPFGGGPRICIGNSFAMMEATLLLARIAQRFRPTLAPGARVATFPSITLRPRYGMKMQITPQRS